MTAQEFEALFHQLVEDVLEDLKHSRKLPKDACEYVERMLNTTVPGGKMNRGLSVPHSFKLMKPNCTADELEKASILGWCVEWLQAFFLVADDIMDHSQTRRGQPCWYLLPEIGLKAINDSFILESCIYMILRKYFRHEPYYVDLLELFHEVTYQTEMGQLLDLLTAPEGKTELKNFDMNRYLNIVQYKTAYYSFYLPVALAMHMNSVKSAEAFKQAEAILIPLGNFFQIQDDYLDCYGLPEVIGKIGTDIQDNKCSWLVVQALSRANSEQRMILEENYGRKESHHVQAVKDLYAELSLESVYKQYEEQAYSEVVTAVHQLSGHVPKEVFLDFAKRIFKRQK